VERARGSHHVSNTLATRIHPKKMKTGMKMNATANVTAAAIPIQPNQRGKMPVRSARTDVAATRTIATITPLLKAA